MNEDWSLRKKGMVSFRRCTSVLCAVHISNNVEATGNFVACCFDIVAGVDRALG